MISCAKGWSWSMQRSEDQPGQTGGQLQLPLHQLYVTTSAFTTRSTRRCRQSDPSNSTGACGTRQVGGCDMRRTGGACFFFRPCGGPCELKAGLKSAAHDVRKRTMCDVSWPSCVCNKPCSRWAVPQLRPQLRPGRDAWYTPLRV